MEKVIETTVSTDWKDVLLQFPKWDVVSDELEKEKRAGKTVYPDEKDIFRCFNYFSMAETRVVIIGQDCYHTPGVANGLAFATAPGNPVPPSLKNIYKEIKLEYPDYVVPENADLTRWATQGVLLLNMALTVRKGWAASHSALWQSFASYMVRAISDHTVNVVFLLWGNTAKGRKALINEENHCVLESGHPSPLSAKHFLGCNHFKLANEYLERTGKPPIQW